MAFVQSGKSQHEVKSILSRLETALKTNEIPAPASIPLTGYQECDEMLTSLHLHTRTIRNYTTDPLTTKHGMSVVAGYGFEKEKIPAETRRKALRCLNNILVLAEPLRQVFVDEKYPEKVIEILKDGDADDELAASNLLVFASARTKVDLTPYFEAHDLAGIVNKNILRHAEAESTLTNDPVQPCIATLKLLSTLAVLCPKEAHRFLPSLQPILNLLQRVAIPSPPLESPVQPLVSCLFSIPFHERPKEDAAESPFSMSVVDKLLDVLEASLKVYSDQVSEMNLLPLMATLSRVAQSVDQGSEVYLRLQSRLLPTEEDRKEVLGRGTSLPHRVVKLGANSLAPELRDCTLSMLFQLSDKDPTRLVRNVGFGNAAGYLTSKGINISQEDLQSRSANAAAEAAINPITGQRLNAEPEVDMPPMTREEREREAERLFVLFERLRATGVMNVDNPAAQASRIQELSSSDDEE